MRINLNLAVAESVRDRYSLAWALPATLAGLLGLVLLAVSGVREFREYRAVRRQVAEVQQREGQLRAQGADIRRELEKPEFRELLRQARFINTLIDQKQLSPAALAARLADLLPDDARLTGLAVSWQGEDLVVRMGVSGKDEEAIEAFLGDLEDAPDFKDVTIINQGFEEVGAQPGQVSIACTARYLPGAQ
jgi:Tfp pilus assembly protein PilN